MRWDKGAIDMLELTDGGGTLTGKNAQDLLVQGHKRGRRDSIFGIWGWSFGPSGNVVENGTVDFQTDYKMKWSTDGGSGTWSGPMKKAILLRWKTGASAGSIDMLELKGYDDEMEGKNAKDWTVRARKRK